MMPAVSIWYGKENSSGQQRISDFKHKYGPWALITGGAQGMGEAFARAIAAHGVNLVLLDREVELLQQTAVTLGRDTGVEVITAATDLANPRFLNDLQAQTGHCDIGLVVACAAVGQVGAFEDIPLDDMLAGVQVNVNAALVLAHTYCQPMLQRGRGGMIFFASSAAYQGTPYVASYAATKAYNLLLGEALWHEWRERGIDVLAISPGATNTSGFRRANPSLKPGQQVKGVLLPEQTAAAALKALGNKPSARPSWRDTLHTFFTSRVLSRAAAVKMIGDKISHNLKLGTGNR